MKGRLAFLAFAGLVSAWVAGELYVSMRQNAADEEVRRLNSVPSDEDWAISGSYDDAPGTRAVEQGPLATPWVFFERDPALGYRLRPNLRAAPMRARRGGHIEFDVAASTDRFGWRLTPQVPNAPADVLFFGDVFGTKLNDGETLPARFSAAFGGKALALNIGVPGWSAAQYRHLLAEDGLRGELELGRVTNVFYVIGVPQRRPYLGGGLCDFSSLCSLLKGSVTIAALDPAPSELAELAKDVRKRYSAGFTVVLWNPESAAADARESALVAAGLDVIPARAAVSGSKVLDAKTIDTLGNYLAQRLGR